MRIRAVLGSILGSVTVLVIGWQAGASAAHNAAALASRTPSSTTSTGGSASGAGSTPTPSGTATAAPATTPSTGVTGTFVGSTVQTPFGSVRVEIQVANSKITDVKALKLTDQGGRSVEISNYAAPILRKEVLAAQSANVDSVGGATYTSDGYLSSVQSAIDKAKL